MNLAEMARAYRASLPPNLRRTGATIPEHEAMAVALAHAEACYRPGITTEVPAALHVAMLAVRSAYRPRVYTLRPTVARTVVETDLHTLPDAAPQLIADHDVGGVIEVRRPECGNRLWGSVTSLGWYWYGAKLMIIGLTHPDGIAVTGWTPQWHGGEIAAGAPTDVIGDKDKHDEFLDAAVRYLITLGLLIEARPSPIRIVRDADDRVIDAYLGEHPRPPPSPAPARENDAEQVGPVIGLQPWPVRVTGHLKRQPYGPGRTARKWIYVAHHEARRWCDPRYRAELRDTWRPYRDRQSKGEHLG